MGLFRGHCSKCNFPLWRSNDECRGCWLAFDEDDRNKRIALRFWGRKGFDWVGLTALGIARATARVVSGPRAEVNSTENSPASSLWLPHFSIARTEAFPSRGPDEDRYLSWQMLRTLSLSEMNDFHLAADMKIQLR